MAICPKTGKGLKKTKCVVVRNCSGFSSKDPFSNSLKVFYLHLELPSDQENNNDFAVELLWFGYGEETSFRHLEKFRE